MRLQASCQSCLREDQSPISLMWTLAGGLSSTELLTTCQLATLRVSNVRERERQRPPKTEAAVSLITKPCIWHTSLLPYSSAHKDQPWHQVGGGPTGSEQQEVGPLGHLREKPPQPLTPSSHPTPAEFEVRKRQQGKECDSELNRSWMVTAMPQLSRPLPKRL